MTSGAPRAAGFDPKTREIAETLARQAGLSLPEWLAGMGGGADGQDTASAEPEERFEAPAHPADEMIRMTAALDRLSRRIETSETRSNAAIVGVERTVRGALSRLGETERQQAALASRFDGVIADTLAEREAAAQRLARIEDEAAGPRSAEALRSLEQTLGKVATHLYGGEERTASALAELRARIDEVETAGAGAGVVEAVVSRIGARIEETEERTSAAMRELQASVASLNTRLGSLESAPNAGVDPASLNQLAVDLAGRVESAKAELDARLLTMAESQMSRVDDTLGQMSEHLRAGEQRSALAVERMGREVVDMAGALVRRVQVVERGSADAIEQLGGDVARIANAVEAKLGRADAIQAKALETLGVEIARITERLAERIGGSERRSAAAIDDVGEQVARAAERLSQRQEHAADELAERIRLSEERTARILDEARAIIERLAREKEPQPAPDPDPAFGLRGDSQAPQEAIYGEDPFTLFQSPPPAAPAIAATTAEAAPEAPPVEPDADDTGYSYVGVEPDLPAPALAATAFAFEPEPEAGAPWAEDFRPQDFDRVEADQAASPPPESWQSEPTVAPGLDQLAPFGAAMPAPEVAAAAATLTTREAVERGRAAAMAAGSWRASPRGGENGGFATAAPGGLFARIPNNRAKRRAGGAQAAVGAGLAAAFGLALGGFWILEGDPHGVVVGKFAELFAPDGHVTKRGEGSRLAEASGTGPSASLPQLAVALLPATTRPGIQGPIASLERAPDLSGPFAAALARIEAKDAGAVDDLRKVAAQGYAPAQFYLSKLYENGDGGLKKDPVQARLWTMRAAAGGEAKAMHNLALDYFEGVGGPKDPVLAASWFRKAAELGLVDSQYNLGRLYEEGLGVAQNPAEAYKWYLVAGRSGDPGSQAAATRMRAQLSAGDRAASERTAQTFRAGAAQPSTPALAAAAAAAAPASLDLVTAQRALSALGYYQGPTDGTPSPALRLALSAYQHDQGLPMTGAIDPVTVGKLSALTRQGTYAPS